MEPQIIQGGMNYNYEGQKIYGRKSGCMKFGLAGLIFSFFILVGIAALAYFVILPKFNIPLPFSIASNDLLDATIVPSKEGERIWIIADGSFNYIKKVTSPGKFSMGRECIDCKTWTYIYDLNGNMLNKIKTEQQDIITAAYIEYLGGKVWTFVEGYGDNPPKLETYDPETGNKISTTEDFLKKYPELSSGFAEMRFDKEEKVVKLKTKDGRNIIFDPEKESLVNEKSVVKDSTIVSMLILGKEPESLERKVLYKVTGPKSKLEESSLVHSVNNPSSLKFFHNATAEKIGGVYLEGIIYHRDDDCTIIIHLDQIGKQANRIMTCLDSKTGKEMWTVKNNEMFDKMKIDEDKDSLSKVFFSKDKIGVERSGNIIILHMQYEGVIIYDYKTGKKIKEIDL